jgi:hypothetical protein
MKKLSRDEMKNVVGGVSLPATRWNFHLVGTIGSSVPGSPCLCDWQDTVTGTTSCEVPCSGYFCGQGVL